MDEELFDAAARGDVKYVNELVTQEGADVNWAHDRQNGWTPLIRAAMNGHAAVAKLLLESGADVNKANSCGGTALCYAARDFHESVVSILLDRCADVNKPDNDGWTPLMHAAGRSRESIVHLLLSRPDIDTTLQKRQRLSCNRQKRENALSNN